MDGMDDLEAMSLGSQTVLKQESPARGGLPTPRSSVVDHVLAQGLEVLDSVSVDQHSRIDMVERVKEGMIVS